MITTGSFENPEIVEIVQTTISFEPLEQNLPAEVEAFKNEFFLTPGTDPKKTYYTLEHLVEKYPQIPTLRNWRQVAFKEAVADDDELALLILEDYREFPNYLFTQAAYAQLCLKNGRWEEVPAIFKNKIILNDVYPERNIFHVTEFLVFYSLMGQYHCYAKNLEVAQSYLQIISEIDAEHPAVNLLLSTILRFLPEELCRRIFAMKNKNKRKAKPVQRKRRK